MEIPIHTDTKGQKYVEWRQGRDGLKRAWVQHKTDPSKNWAEVEDGRYLNVVRVEAPGAGPAGNATDFPIFSKLDDEQILVAFVASVSAITGAPLEFC